MNRTTQLAAFATVLLIAMGITHFATSADDSNKPSDQLTYRTMFRHDLDQLGGHEKGKLLRINSTKTLQSGLNQMSADGWELVAVEGGRSVPVTGPNQMKLIYPPVYIFRRAQR